MSGSNKQRNRPERINSLGIQKPKLVQWWLESDKADFMIRMGLAVLAAVTLLAACQTWRPQFAYRKQDILSYNLITRVSFEVENQDQTKALRDRKAREQLAFYSNRSKPLYDLQAALRDQLFLVLAAPSYEEMKPDERAVFSQFKPRAAATSDETPANRFAEMQQVFADDPKLEAFKRALEIAFQPNYRIGLIQSLEHSPEKGAPAMIRVYQDGNPEDIEFVEMKNARIAEAAQGIEKRIKEEFRTKFPAEASQEVAVMMCDWLVERLPEYQTLSYDEKRSLEAADTAAAEVQPVMTTYRTGTDVLAVAGVPLGDEQLLLLRKEWSTLVEQMSWTDKVARVVAYAGMIVALYLLCGSYIFFVDDRRLLQDRGKLAKLLVIIVTTIVLGHFASADQWRGELVPLVLASILTGVVYGRELALLLMAATSVSMTLLLGEGLPQLVMMAAAFTSCTLLLGRIRTRTHLFYVGATSAVITILTVVGVGIVTGTTLSDANPGGLTPVYQGPRFDTVVLTLFRDAFWSGFCIVVSATAMTGLLPLVEKAFGVQTDLSLLELGDASHPLLRRLAQRAPGTYNHSINVASIAEAAADEIGANGLLVRVGAYFHDIGKMFKPEYFIENQSEGINQHDSLQPAMSTLVIIAHVKDGADLARSHHLPKPIIDFILQHHGTTLVEYFYREASRRSEKNPDAESVSDKDFRYPGPKPQTLEAAVMMLADAVESASRTLVDPTPARIQGLVDMIAEKKMTDGQFDECGLTFQQLATIRRSLQKSLTAIYHARVKYPGQQTA
jgi:putative nucleotidyltransferase with HDIG domain